MKQEKQTEESRDNEKTEKKDFNLIFIYCYMQHCKLIDTTHFLVLLFYFVAFKLNLHKIIYIDVCLPIAFEKVNICNYSNCVLNNKREGSLHKICTSISK